MNLASAADSYGKGRGMKRRARFSEKLCMVPQYPIKFLFLSYHFAIKLDLPSSGNIAYVLDFSHHCTCCVAVSGSLLLCLLKDYYNSIERT